MITGRISDLERSVQHFDTGLTVQVEADLDEIRADIKTLHTTTDNLSRLRDADLQRSSPHWVVDALQDEVTTLKIQVESLMED